MSYGKKWLDAPKTLQNGLPVRIRKGEKEKLQKVGVGIGEDEKEVQAVGTSRLASWIAIQTELIDSEIRL